jgi:hypothetical protein
VLVGSRRELTLIEVNIRLLINNRRTHERLTERILYQISDVGIVNDVAVPELEMYRIENDISDAEYNSDFLAGSHENWVPYYKGSGTLYSGNVEIFAFSSESNIRLSVKGFGDTYLSLSDNQIMLASNELFNRPELLTETILSPALMLTLANSGYFALHGSAIETPKGVLVFCGESGQGKSTLARELGRGPKISRVADDIVLWTSVDGIPYLHTYPQLKLDYQDQPNFTEPKEIKGIYRLNTEDSEASVSLLDLLPSKQLLEVMRHTVAIRLYTNKMQKGLMKALPLALRSAPMQRLSYPKRMESIDQVRELLEL